MPAHSHNYSTPSIPPTFLPPAQKNQVGSDEGSCFHIQKQIIAMMLPFISPPPSTKALTKPFMKERKKPIHSIRPAQSRSRLYKLPPASCNRKTENRVYSPFLNPQVGFSAAIMSSFVLTVSPGNLLTRCAPLRIALRCIAETPLRLLRMLPASLMLSWSRNTRLGGAKSREVKVPDLRRE